MLGIIGKKLGMTQVFNEQGHQVPCTVVEAKPNPITKVISGEREKPGYRAIEFLEEGRAHAAGTTREQGRVAARGQGRCRGRTAHAPRVPAR
jgi:large subunit ribosomal protein L3